MFFRGVGERHYICAGCAEGQRRSVLVNMWLVCSCKHALSLLAAERSLITGKVCRISRCFLSQALWLELLIMWHFCFPFRRCRTERLWFFPPWRCWWSHGWWAGHQEGWWSGSNCRNSQLGYLCQVCTEEYMSTGESVPSLDVSIYLQQTDVSHMPFSRLGLAGTSVKHQWRTCSVSVMWQYWGLLTVSKAETSSAQELGVAVCRDCIPFALATAQGSCPRRGVLGVLCWDVCWRQRRQHKKDRQMVF